MIALSRRHLLAGAAAAGLAVPLAARTAHAAAPPAGKQVPGIYRSKLGEFEVTSFNDGVAPR